MRKIFVILFSLTLIIAVFIGTATRELNFSTDDFDFSTSNFPIVQIQLKKSSDLGKLIDYGIILLDVEDSFVNAEVSYEDLDWLFDAGFSYEIIFEDIAEMRGWKDNPGILQDFHTYPELTAELELIAATYPNISALYDLGHSVQGRSIWGLKVTDNPTIEENEPEVRICGAHHGDELMSIELPLYLAWLLVENYSVDPYITNLVDNREIWIIPMVNPDGRMAHPSPTRRNANNVDLNRDYGYIWGGSGGSPSPFSQPETQVIREHALDNNFVLSLSFHCSGDIVNYVWNYKDQPVVDNEVVVILSEQYGSHNGYWVVEGYNWYQTRGDTNDFSYGCRGDIDWTIEVQTYGHQQAWDYNRDAMIEIIDAADMGLTGVVTDAFTGDPINATVWVEELYWPCFTDPKVGDYHRTILPGNYTVYFRANGYEEQVHFIEVLDSDEPTQLNVSLYPGGGQYAFQVTWCNIFDSESYPVNFQNNPTEVISALGQPDGVFASMGKGGVIVLDMGEEGVIYNNPDDDFIVYEGDGTSEGYDVEVSETWDGTWTSVGSGMGTTYFDLEDGGVESARFIKIIDDNDGIAGEFNPGFDLDAIEVLSMDNATVYVDDDFDESTPGWGFNRFDNIQDGIDAVAENGTVYVNNGIYYENVVIDKTINLIGENKNSTIINGSAVGNCIEIISNRVNVSHLSTINSGDYSTGNAGIEIIGSSYCSITNCNSYQHGFHGLRITSSTDCNIINCNFYDGAHISIRVNDHRIKMKNCKLINSSMEYGSTSTSHIIENCELYMSQISYRMNSNDIIMRNCSFSYSITDYGIKFHGSGNNNIITNCTISNITYGFYGGPSFSNNYIYHNNFINNSFNAYDEGNNIWDNGYPNGGNYWDNYDEPGEGAWDNNTDGIIDKPYNILGGDNQDLYPLMFPYISQGIFRRADINFDGEIEMSDGISILRYLYVPGAPTPSCMDSADVDDDGNVSINDAIYLFRHIYIPNAPVPPAPFLECGLDPTEDTLDCELFPYCGNYPCIDCY